MGNLINWCGDYCVLANHFAGLVAFIIFLGSILIFIIRKFYRGEYWEKLEGWLADPVNYPELLNDYQNSAEDGYFHAIRKVSYFANRTYGHKPFSLRAFGACLTISYVYPIIATLLAWLVVNSASPGDFTLFPDNSIWWDRLWRSTLLALAWVPLFLVANFAEFLSNEVRDRILNIFSKLSTQFGFLAMENRGLIAEILGATTFAIFFAFATIIAFYSTVNSSGAFAVAVTVATVFIVASVKTGDVSTAFVGFAIFITATAFVKGIELMIVLIFFYVLLPIANAAADFLSIGATRWFLRRVARRKSSTRVIITGLILDLGFGLLCLGLLLVTLTGSLDLWTWLSPNTVPLDWRTYWAEIQSDKWSGLALYLMLATTLLPTAIHVIAGLGSILTHKSRRQKRAAERIQEHIDNGEAMTGIMAHNTMRLVRGATLWGYGLSTTGVLALFGIMLWWIF